MSKETRPSLLSHLRDGRKFGVAEDWLRRCGKKSPSLQTINRRVGPRTKKEDIHGARSRKGPRIRHWGREGFKSSQNAAQGLLHVSLEPEFKCPENCTQMF